MSIQIGEVSRRIGLSVDTIRFYEKQALLPILERTKGGYRAYSPPDIERLQFIGRAQNLGFSLKEIREFLLIEGSPETSCSHVQDLIAAKIALVRDKLTELQHLESRLSAAQQHCNDALVSTYHAECPVLKELKPKEAQ